MFCDAFFTYYNTEHRHSGIAMHTPASVHDGTWIRDPARRVATLQAAYLAHPERFRGRCPLPKDLPARVWINEPPATIETSHLTTNHTSSLMSLSKPGARYTGLLPARLPGLLAEPAVRLSTQRALHGSCRQAGSAAHGLGIWVPR